MRVRTGLHVGQPPQGGYFAGGPEAPDWLWKPYRLAVTYGVGISFAHGVLRECCRAFGRVLGDQCLEGLAESVIYHAQRHNHLGRAGQEVWRLRDFDNELVAIANAGGCVDKPQEPIRTPDTSFTIKWPRRGIRRRPRVEVPKEEETMFLVTYACRSTRSRETTFHNAVADDPVKWLLDIDDECRPQEVVTLLFVYPITNAQADKLDGELACM